MTDSPSSDFPSSENEASNPFEQMGGSDPDAQPSFESPDPAGTDDPFASAKLQASFALDLARAWVKDHQRAAMLGAFATGVVLGSLFRD
jgi:hypothetical protein